MSRLGIFFLIVITLGLAILLSWLGWSTIPANVLGWFLLITALTYFVGVIVVYWIRRIRFWGPRAGGEVMQQEKTDSSFWLIVLGMVSAFDLPPIEYLYLKAFLPRGVGMQIMGLFITFMGSVLFVWARRTLGEFYSGHVSVIEGQSLVQHGPYHFIRHPAYAGYLLITLGLCLGYSSLGGLLMMVCVMLPSVIYRIRVEDKVPAAYFGTQFTKYTHKTPRLIPGVW